jgi:hypothetical protein
MFGAEKYERELIKREDDGGDVGECEKTGVEERRRTKSHGSPT